MFPANLSDHDAQAISHREPGTSAWFLDGSDLHKWTTDDNTAPWMHGDMGCGKTWLCAAIEQKLREDAKQEGRNIRLAACYFSNAAATIDA